MFDWWPLFSFLSAVENVFGLLRYRTNFSDLFHDLKNVFVRHHVLQSTFHWRELTALTPDKCGSKIFEERLMDLHNGMEAGKATTTFGEDDWL